MYLTGGVILPLLRSYLYKSTYILSYTFFLDNFSELVTLKIFTTAGSHEKVPILLTPRQPSRPNFKVFKMFKSPIIRRAYGQLY